MVGYIARIVGCASVVGVLMAAPALASDALVNGARLCTQYFPTAEQRHGIPSHLLAAISSTESGRWHKGLGLALPWPWTINVEGQGHYFDTKAEAIARTAAYVRAGRSVDVGCMQVNLRHHPNAFASLNDAFDPQQNVEYAAKFLRNNYEDLGDWVKATAAYHSRTPYYGSRYLGLIEKSWNRIVAKVQQARERQGSPQLDAAAPNFAGTRQQLASAAPAAPVASRPVEGTRGVKVVKVKDAVTQKRQDVLVINPQAPPVIKVADARTAAVPAGAPVKVESDAQPIKRILIDEQGRAAESSPRSNATFVFAN